MEHGQGSGVAVLCMCEMRVWILFVYCRSRYLRVVFWRIPVHLRCTQC